MHKKSGKKEFKKPPEKVTGYTPHHGVVYLIIRI
jgi:hypothetical protein